MLILPRTREGQILERTIKILRRRAEKAIAISKAKRILKENWQRCEIFGTIAESLITKSNRLWRWKKICEKEH